MNSKKINRIGIYKITSPSGKIYIGQSVHIQNRFSKYRKLNCKTQTKLYRSFLKYGVENHTFEIIHLCKEEKLNHFEIHFINLYNTFNTKFGLNLKDGGSKGKPSSETKIKMSKSHEGEKNHFFNKKHTPKAIKRMSNSKKGKNNPNYGKKISEETRKILSEKRKGKNNPFYGKKHSDEVINKLKKNKPSLKTRKKMSESKKGDKNHFFNKTHSDKSRKKISKSREGKYLGSDNPFYGKTHSKKTKKIQSEARKLYWKNKKYGKRKL